jgi:hypothetical protein
MKNLHTPVKNLHSWSEETSHRSEKETTERNLTVNGNGYNATPTPIRQLPDLDQPPAQTDTVANEILSELGDEHSFRFYQLVAAKVPYHEIRRALSEIKVDGAQEPPRVFRSSPIAWANTLSGT